ncbi:fungal-specific transcription factor domain-containing protein [Rhodocollybia butyracea]|uniref:Fungal-specific transcription factor domain-containing protein n=1 Tax=Rhodocollybia butyracea TaxID=206335 RepID=A0A9P5PNE8_9AGAR|nr:fungal-specific transcription factor domain-containing protein [Rhodocollybia butyracea]
MSPPPPDSKPTMKKTGAPKAKGAVRAKSGCYTCRIRRKKCDERPDAEGRCETCLRLRLQCLGFGAKRPDWLRENNNVVELRDKIKSFLASQGMIKGHSGSGPRAPEQEPPTLHLSAQNYGEPSDSPQSQLLVLSDEAVRHGPVSNVREQQWPYPPHVAPGYEPHPAGPPPQILHQVGQPSRNPPPFGAPGADGFPPDPQYLHTIPNNSNSLVSPPQWSYHHPANIMHHRIPHLHTTIATALATIAAQASPPPPQLPPTVASRFGSSYTAVIPEDSGEQMFFGSVDGATHPMTRYILPDGTLDELVNHYVNTVASMQYQLADKLTLPKILFEAIETDGFARHAARLLASVHVQRSQAPMRRALGAVPIHEHYEELLRMFSFAKDQFDDDDALAAIHIISSFLFDGGHGDWERWLQVASWYSNSVLADRSRFHDYRDALMSCTDKERFIIKTTFWFDVLSSVTTMTQPNFVDVIDDLYNPSNSGISDASEEDSDSLSMLSIMGCENRIVWALSQISSLYVWKLNREKEGRLSILELSRKANDIEAYLAPPNPPLRPRTEDDIPRSLASEVFRTSAIVYLRTIVSGNHPLVPEISEAVNEAVASLEKVGNAQPKVKHVVVRSTVFAYFVCACLTTKPSKRSFLLKQLEDEGEVGNCHGVLKLLQGLNIAKPREVPWRSILHDSKMLLV